MPSSRLALVSTVQAKCAATIAAAGKTLVSTELAVGGAFGLYGGYKGQAGAGHRFDLHQLEQMDEHGEDEPVHWKKMGPY